MLYISYRYLAGFGLLGSGAVLITFVFVTSNYPFVDIQEFVQIQYAMLIGGIASAIIGAILIPGG
jgi:hypothetical protein